MTHLARPHDTSQPALARPNGAAGLRVVFFGMHGRFSAAALDALFAAGVDVCAVIIAAEQGQPVTPLHPPPSAPTPWLQSDHPRTIVGLAWEHGVGVFAVTRFRSPLTRRLLAELRPDVACVAGFPRRIPPALLAVPRYGFLNMHPSLLPAYRGPSPLFWVLRDGGQHGGVTVHVMDADLDTGPIIAQEPIDLPVGISGPQAERLCATLGGRLLVAALDEITAGGVQVRPQSASENYASTPTPSDFRLEVSWPAERAFAFMRGTAEWDRPYPIVINEATLWLTHALRYDTTACLNTFYRTEGDSVAIQFSPGVLWARARSRR